MEPVPNKLMTLCIIHDHPRVLLGMKKRGFGAGRWNGFGGKVHGNETIGEAAVRGLKEEACIEPRDMEEVGLVHFEFENNEEIVEVHFFKIKDFTGEPVETEEMKPQWFSVDEIPDVPMWSDDSYWMPLFLAGKRFKGRFLFDRPSTPEYQSKIISQELREVEEL